ncbi:hypothetical protein niasHS_002232 [Heterodera schachtii]|uniref:Uncharacterized protein n=1 Tax=Heterodera schachtii TaxID=97005 RepID=A0ABD2KMN2_HETSC
MLVVSAVVREKNERISFKFNDPINARSTPSLFALVNAILFQQRLKRRRLNEMETHPAEDSSKVSAQFAQRTIAREKMSISLKHSQSLPLIRSKKH